nr:reverse transcriptase domain-containing protein [Tanacetum cinerariifolium]
AACRPITALPNCTNRSSSKLACDQTSNPTSSTNPTPKGRIHRSSKQKVENYHFEEHLTPVATMTDNRTMAEMLRAPTEGCAEAIVVPLILAEQFELKHSVINMMTSEQFFGLEKDNPHDHVRWAARRWLEKEPPRLITTWDDLVLKFINEFFPPSRTTNLHQDSLNAAAGGNLLEKSPQYALTIIETKSKVRNSRRKPIASPVNAYDNHSSSEIAKLTHAVNQQTSAVTTAMTAMLKQLQSNPPPAQVKAVEEICVTCGGDHSYYQCLVAGGNTFPEFRDNIQGYVSAAAGNYNQGNPGYRPQGVANQMRPPGFAQPNVQNNQNRFGQPQGFNRTNFNQEQPCQATTQSNQNFHLNELEKIKRMNDVSLKAMQNQIDMMNIASTSGSRSLPGNTIAKPKGELKAITTRSGLVTDGHTVSTPPKSVNPKEDECVEETYTNPDLAEYTIKVPPPPVQKPKPSIQRNFVLHTRDSHLPHIPELKCKALADLGASINLMPLSVWTKLGLPDLIPTQMTLELANRAICTPDGIARDVFVPVGKFTFPADFVVVDYKSDPRVPLILGRPFLRTAHALIDVHGEEMILRDGDERLTLNMKHDTTCYSNHPHGESANLINIFNASSEDFFEDMFSNKQSGNPTFSLHKEIASPEEFADELALITYPPDYDDNLTCDIESDLREIEFLLYHGEDSDFKDSIDQTDLANIDDLFVDPTPEMFTDEQPLDYLFSPRFDVYPDDFLEIESDADNFDDDLFDSKGEKIKEAELLIDQLDLPCDILLEYDSFAYQDFSRDDDLPSPDNEDKVFNPGILIYEKSVKIITRVAQEKNLAVSFASLLFEDFDPPFYELLVFKKVPNSMRLLPFSSENEEKVFKPGIYISKKVHFCFLPELSHPGYHIFKFNMIFISPMKIFHVQSGKNTPILDVLLFYFYPL